MARLGTITLQALDDSDIFLKTDVYLDGITDPAETLEEISEPGLPEQDLAWVNGSVPKVIKVNIEGDASIIEGWFKGDNYTSPFRIQVYVEYEETEEVIEYAMEEGGEKK
jgi:hypothetical protein